MSLLRAWTFIPCWVGIGKGRIRTKYRGSNLGLAGILAVLSVTLLWLRIQLFQRGFKVSCAYRQLLPPKKRDCAVASLKLQLAIVPYIVSWSRSVQRLYSSCTIWWKGKKTTKPTLFLKSLIIKAHFPIKVSLSSFWNLFIPHQLPDLLFFEVPNPGH